MVDWVGAENTGIPYALALALRRKPIREIVGEAGVPASSLYSIRKHGPYEHRNRQKL